MAILSIAEFPGMGWVGSVGAPIAGLPETADQDLSIGGSSALSSAFGTNTRVIRVHTDTACRILVGTAPVAVATSMPLSANQTEYFAVAPGQKLAVIQF